MALTVFTRARWGAGLAATMTMVAASQYPGGTFLDRSSSGYSFDHNFLSDLGMTVAWGGQPNRLGAVLFVVSLCLVVIGFGASLVGFVRLYSASRASRTLARAALVVGLLVCLAFIGVAVTPEDLVMSIHVQLTLLAFRLFPGVPLLLALSSWKSDVFPRRVGVVWALFAVVLAAYVVVLGWGPQVRAPHGLVVQVTAQKIVAIAAVLVLAYQTFEADRVLSGQQAKLA
jgi:hypothetical membrane protein